MKIRIHRPIYGIPITFLDKYCPDQFEIVGCSSQYGDCGVHYGNTNWGCLIDGKGVYARILIRHRKAQLMEYGKKFLVIGNQNAIINRDIFPLIKNNQLWLGMNNVKEFRQPNGEIKKFGNICWFTNLNNEKRNRPIDLYKHYSNEYKHYDNYDAIEVGKTCDIPMDYDGVMGVPLTFLDKYCPEQFEILGVTNNTKENAYGIKENTIGYSTWASINGKNVYARILIRHRK